MKKLSIIIILLAIGTILYFANGRNMSQKSPDSLTRQENATGTQAASVKQDIPLIGSIKDAMGLGKKMACSYPSTDGTNASSTVFIDGQKIKFMTAVNGETMYGLFDNDTQYTWTSGEKKQGMKMSKTCLEEIKNLVPQQAQSDNSPQTQNYQSFENMQNVNCVEANNTEDFSLPTDITFTDQCEMMRKAMQGMNQFKGKLPDGVKIPTSY